MANRIRRVIFSLMAVFLFLFMILAVGGRIVIARSFPRTDGEVQLPGLNAPVDIYRDRFGIPHIYATTQHDLFFAQGYVHAQDRFWQMDFWRHIGSGRLSEMFGESQVETDIFLRTLGWERVAKEEIKTLDSTSLSILEAYAEGVNAYLAERQGAALSLEYAILKLTNADYQPEPWQPIHTLTWAKVMAWDLGGNMDDEIEIATLLKTLSPEQIAEIIPPYPEDMPVIVPGFQMQAKSGAHQPRSDLTVPSLPAALPALEKLKDRLASIEALLGPRSLGLGSNSWVISGDLTSTGKPFLANDPHLGAQIPAIWYEVGLHCTPKGEGCPFDVTGFSFAGAPGVIIGHNDRIAWGFTNVGPDVQDLYIEKINPENPNQYEVNGKWQDMLLVKERITVAGSDPVEITVRYTRHGPLISDAEYLPEDFADVAGIELPEHYGIALRWTALEPMYTFRAIWGFNKAENWEEFRQAASQFDAPAQNLVYADVDGNIGYQMPGKIPLRAGGDGMLPVPGWTDDFEWTGYIPFEALPFTFNPPQGYVVTANNAVVSTDYPYLISNVFAYGYRAKRIVELIENAPGAIDQAYIQKMQGDNKDLNAEALVPLMQQVVLGTDGEAARQILNGWDYQDHMDSAPAALFAAFWKNLLALTFQDDLPEDFWPRGGDRWFTVVARLIEQPDSPWWDIRSTSAREDRDSIFAAAFAAAVQELEGTLGKDPQKWSWGDLHTLTLVNQSLGESGIAPIEALFNRGTFRTSGGSDIVNATGWSALEGYEVRSVPSMRMIVDLSDLSRSLSIHTTGQSGHAYHKHYVDMTDLWRTIQYHPMLWTRSQVESSAEGHLVLKP